MSAQEREADVQIPHLQQTPTGWRYRRRILPRDLAKHLGGTEWKSPIFAQRWQAVREVERLTAIHDELVGRWKNGQSVDYAPEFGAAVQAKAEHLRDARDVETLNAEIGRMQDSAFMSWATSPRAKEAERYFEELHGGPISIVEHATKPGEVSLNDLWERVGRLNYLPVDEAALKLAHEGGSTFRPRFMPLTRAYARDITEHGGKRDEKYVKFAVDAFVAAVGDVDFFAMKRSQVEAWTKAARARGWAEATVKRRTVALQGIHTRLLIAFDMPASAVWRKLGLTDAADGKERLPLNAGHLAALGDHLASGAVSAKLRRVIALMKATGVGAKELAGLRKRDFVLDHKVPHVIVRTHEGRGLKTSTRGRTIPLFGEALKAAKEAVADAPGEYVFVRSVKKNTPQMISKQVNQVLRAAGIPNSRRLTAYSFRHGLAEAMKIANMREDLRKFVLGHAQKGVTAKYGASAPLLEELSKELRRSHRYLGKIDDSIYEPIELMPSKSR